MSLYAAGNNTVAIALDEGRIDVDDAKTYRELARVARAFLDAWGATISLDGKTDDGASRAAAEAAFIKARSWLARVRVKQ